MLVRLEKQSLILLSDLEFRNSGSRDDFGDAVEEDGLAGAVADDDGDAALGVSGAGVGGDAGGGVVDGEALCDEFTGFPADAKQGKRRGDILERHIVLGVADAIDATDGFPG